MDIYGILKRCQYRNCKNGRYNNSQLFYFTSQKERQKIWIENSGNYALRNWKPSSVTSAGLCRDHFKETDFIKGKRGLRLKRGSIPINWKEALKNQNKVDPNDLIQDDNIPSKNKSIEIVQEEYDIDEELLELNKDL